MTDERQALDWRGRASLAAVESAAINAGTHIPAVDDFGNQYLAAQVPAQEERLREALVFWAEGWDGEPGSLPTPEGMRNLYAIVEQARALGDESKEEGAG